jgi:hypothetical protein
MRGLVVLIIAFLALSATLRGALSLRAETYRTIACGERTLTA